MNRLVNQFVDDDKYVTAICNGVGALSLMRRPDGSSLLDGRTVSSFAGYIPAACGVHRTTRSVLEANGATQVASGSIGDPNTVEDDVIIDGRIITAENWDAASVFGEVIALRLIDDVFSDF